MRDFGYAIPWHCYFFSGLQDKSLLPSDKKTHCDASFSIGVLQAKEFEKRFAFRDFWTKVRIAQRGEMRATHSRSKRAVFASHIFTKEKAV
ncbi:MAG: hypothetical protein IJU76_00605 [Desulfovibrionaceae bacterium]|nr:hypothetical protein [Desulfovibrionaceae bacterium]